MGDLGMYMLGRRFCLGRAFGESGGSRLKQIVVEAWLIGMRRKITRKEVLMQGGMMISALDSDSDVNISLQQRLPVF
jgi:hypothetical protein